MSAPIEQPESTTIDPLTTPFFEYARQQDIDEHIMMMRVMLLRAFFDWHSKCVPLVDDASTHPDEPMEQYTYKCDACGTDTLYWRHPCPAYPHDLMCLSDQCILMLFSQETGGAAKSFLAGYATAASSEDGDKEN